MISLVKKYNVSGPRYTSYPTVPYWESESFNEKIWKQEVTNSFRDHGAEGMSLYIHLPYCESLCTYCGCNTRITVNHEVEIPYIEAVLQEWESYKRIIGKNAKIREIHLGGGTPTFFSPENLRMLMEGILGDTAIMENAEFSFEAHPANTTIDHLNTLYDIGFRRLSLGIQDFDPEVQNIINRFQSYDQVKNVTEAARSIGYTSINYDFIYGLPKQTISGIVNTADKIISLRPDRIAFYSYAHVPWLKPGQRKYTEQDLPDAETKIRLHQIVFEILTKEGYKEIGMDHFALPNDDLCKAMHDQTLHRNFMGYTTCSGKLLIGLGCSSISDTWTAFSQNIKTVEEYIREVKNGHLPVFRGHVLTEEDLFLRSQILNIMCRMTTTWDNKFEGIMRHIKDRMHTMQQDGLVEIGSFYIKVTDSGKPFLRNIGMCFDERLHQSINKEQLFSKTI